jgi:hypothetical protein
MPGIAIPAATSCGSAHRVSWRRTPRPSPAERPNFGTTVSRRRATAHPARMARGRASCGVSGWHRTSWGRCRGSRVAARLAADRAYIDALRRGAEPVDPRLDQDWLAGPTSRTWSGPDTHPDELRRHRATVASRSGPAQRNEAPWRAGQRGCSGLTAVQAWGNECDATVSGGRPARGPAVPVLLVRRPIRAAGRAGRWRFGRVGPGPARLRIRGRGARPRLHGVVAAPAPGR